MKPMPTLDELRRNRAGVLSIAAQMTLALAILCNAIFVIHEMTAWTNRPTGIDEPDIFVIESTSTGAQQTWAPREKADLAALRALDGVVGAYATNAVPLSNAGNSVALKLTVDQQQPTTMAALYYTGAEGLNTLGLQLIAGRTFAPDEVGYSDPEDPAATSAGPGAVIVTSALARKLYPHGSALGRPVFLQGDPASMRIVGIVKQLQVPWTAVAGWGSTFSEDSLLIPAQLVHKYVLYVVRVRPGRVAAVEKAAVGVLQTLDRLRTIGGPYTMAQKRETAYRDDRGLSLFLAVITSCLLGVTAAGIVGLTSYWVAKRKRQIGIRRALGATRGGIVWYFLGEILMITLPGVIAGMFLAIALNLWVISAFALPRMPVAYLAGGAVALIALGQLAALWPAWRAASIPPAIATRSA
jgi:putative ABC transport system permease protein